MQSFQLSQCTSIHTHLIGSALFSLLAISWNTKEAEKADRNGQYFFLCVGEIFVSFSRQLVLQSFACDYCSQLLSFSKEECIKCLNLQNSNHNQILYFFIFKGCCRNCSLNKSDHMVIIKQQSLNFGGCPNYTLNKWVILNHWWNSQASRKY